ncbi:MAG TPA: glycosyltransferase, partial [Azospirillum sp.]
VGGLRAEKNLGRLLRVMARLPADLPVHAVIVGDGPERAELERAAAPGLAGRVTFLGGHARPEALLPWFDVFVLPSDTEQMPLSLLEAMATGLPAVATDVGDVRAVVAAENHAFIVPKHDEAAFADRLAALLRDAEGRRAVGRANRLRAERHFAAETMVAAYDTLYAA